MFSRLMFFVVGAAAGVFARDALRDVAKSAIAGAYKARLAVQELAVEAVEDLHDEAAAAAKRGATRTQ